MMAGRGLTLGILPGSFTVSRLPAETPVPEWALHSAFFSITRTADELSIVCPQVDVPDNIEGERDWRCLRIDGAFDFGQIGILRSVLAPLAEAGIGIFATSTFQTDYVMVKSADLARAVAALRQAEHTVLD